MKAQITTTGTLEITAENETENYALNLWAQNSLFAIDNYDNIELMIGSFQCITNKNDNGIVDNALEVNKISPLISPWEFEGIE